jgi:hypothetical protein
MQMPETPTGIDQLDLMKKLDDYAQGKATWLPEQTKIGHKTRQACQVLHAGLVLFAENMLTPLLARINAREMETFTMHDADHALKVAHLIWHILTPERRETLTPPEIALLIVSAFLHDLGMALSPQQRDQRLDPDSDLWHHLEIDQSLKDSINRLKQQAADGDASDSARDRARRKLCQAEEALLCRDNRDRHTTAETYEQLLSQLQQFHESDPTKLPDVESCLCFDGDSFREKLIEICVSHGRDLDFLLEKDEKNIERPRFPNDYTLGPCTADLHMVAAALRLADILDFDRERTPPVLFHYLLPTNLAPQDDKSVLEWSKHLVISNWHIESDAVIFRGRCTSHVVHHAVVQFCEDIESETKATRSTFDVLNAPFPFALPKAVQTNIEQHGYTYVPYKFELDDHRVYELLMGGAIYDNPLVAARELVQNAVDACKLRDALTKLYDPGHVPAETDRIKIVYQESSEGCAQPTLTVTDSGTGMDRWVLENYFLKVGRSYYRSSDFNEFRFKLRSKNQELDFAPVSEFGIGFLSCFLVADRLEVTTAMWEDIRGDTRKRTLIIDGPTRLIRLSEQKNQGLDRFKGTCVTLYLCRGSEDNKDEPPAWPEIRDYLRNICQDLPYPLHLEHITADGAVIKDRIDRIPLSAQVDPRYESFTIRIPVDDKESGLQGEITLINGYEANKLHKELAERSPVALEDRPSPGKAKLALLRGGFRIGRPEGCPFIGFSGSLFTSPARLRHTWASTPNRRYPLPNLGRTDPAESDLVRHHVVRIWLDWLISNVESLPDGVIWRWDLSRIELSQQLKFKWLEKHNALTIYHLARNAWRCDLGENGKNTLDQWEKSVGSAIVLPGHLLRELLDIVLPKVTTLEVGSNGALCVKPPEAGWSETLRKWQTFITEPVKWDSFAEYAGDIRDTLFRIPACRINSAYRDELLARYAQDDLPTLANTLLRVGAALRLGDQTSLSEREAELLTRAKQQFGHLEICYYDKSWRLDDIETPKLSSSK